MCRSIRECYGQLERICLSYDMAFVALFLSALYEPQEAVSQFRCPMHLLHCRQAVRNEYTDYAADMTIALAYHKCLDDWKDEHKRTRYEYSKLLKGSYEQIRKRYPRQCRMIEDSLSKLEEIENARVCMPDEAVNCSGKMLSELFVYQEDFWSNTLRTFGYELGRFIYLMDAVMDYNEDKKKNNFNPLFGMQMEPGEVETLLTMTIGNAAHQFETLPILKDAQLIRNILYGGVWQKYYVKMRKEKPYDI